MVSLSDNMFFWTLYILLQYSSHKFQYIINSLINFHKKAEICFAENFQSMCFVDKFYK